MEPFGREFEAPIFSNKAQILSFKRVGKDQNHAQFQFFIAGKTLKGIWFFADEFMDLSQLQVGQWVDLAYRLMENTFNGKTDLNLKVEFLKQGVS